MLHDLDKTSGFPVGVQNVCLHNGKRRRKNILRFRNDKADIKWNFSCGAVITESFTWFQIIFSPHSHYWVN